MSCESLHSTHNRYNANDTTSVIVQNIKTATTVKNNNIMTFESFTGSKISLYTHKSVVNSQITNITLLIVSSLRVYCNNDIDKCPSHH